MNRLVSIDHLSRTAVHKRTSEDEENDTKIVKKSQRNRGQECSGNIVEVEAWGVCKRFCTHGQGKDQPRRVDSLICQPATTRR